MALLLAMLSSLCFGMALVTGRVGLRTLDARSGAAISIPTATLLLAAAAPFAFHLDGFSVEAMLLFAVVGLFFPAIVTILTFRSNEELGPTVTSAVSGTAPLFALLAAGLLLGEHIPAQAAAATVAVVAGVGLLSWNQGAVRPSLAGWSLLWPVSGAMVRGLAQVGVKAGLLLWPSAFAASLIGYLVSSATVIAVNRLGRSERPGPTKHSIVLVRSHRHPERQRRAADVRRIEPGPRVAGCPGRCNVSIDHGGCERCRSPRRAAYAAHGGRRDRYRCRHGLSDCVQTLTDARTVRRIVNPADIGKKASKARCPAVGVCRPGVVYATDELLAGNHRSQLHTRTTNLDSGDMAFRLLKCLRKPRGFR